MRISRPLLALPLFAVAILACGLLPGIASPQPGPNATVSDESPAPESFTLVVLHPSHGDLRSILAEHALRAASIDRRPFVEFSADWCPPCVALANSLDDRRMIYAFRGTYIIRLDFDEWKDELSGTGFTVLGVPTFFELDTAGVPTGRMITGAAWGEDVPENMAPPLERFFQGEPQS